MTYYICHDNDHVDLLKECTRVPYGDHGLYDQGCLPTPLTLVGLIEDKRPGDLPDKWICNAADHIRSRHICTTSTVLRNQIISDAHGITGHNWVPYYEVGQYVLIRAKVSSSSRPLASKNRVAVKLDHEIVWVGRDQILGLTQMPIPPEPDRKAILRSKQNQRLSLFSEGVWRSVGGVSNEGLEWPDLWTNYGPFDYFAPDGEIK